ncbi:MAG TPA: 6,7-dimethyl-8-ribityllumazine synthase [Chitinophagales bacterium]|nr:6,7-dimethyl-8-ribityllumazine synthase [Chitinophagales bacterium]
MSSSLKNLSEYDHASIPSGKGKKIGVVVAEWNQHITFELMKGCNETLLQHGILPEDIIISFVPGTFELPFAAKMLAKANRLAGVVCIGCVIKGETKHDEYINHSVAQALQNLNLQYDIPFIFGVLTPNSEQQAIDRAGGKYGNKGVEAAVTVLKMTAL